MSTARSDPRIHRTRTAALSAAREVLIEEGWDAVTHARVAERAGVARATMYRRWPDRAALLQDTLATEVIIQHAIPSGDLRVDLVHELGAFRDRLADDAWTPILTALIDRSEWDPDIMKVKRSLVRLHLHSLRALIEDASIANMLPRLLDPDFGVAQLIGPLLYHRVISSEGFTYAMVEKLVDDFLRANG
jgi:AcrR family transcriptional regulator